MKNDPVHIAKQCYQAYVDKDRATCEKLIAADFHFTSPLDNRIDRKTYFERCWPNSNTTKNFKYIRAFAEGDRAYVTYEGEDFDGHRFQNTEILTVVENRIVDVEVYFGWDLPHPAKPGGFVNPK